LNPSVFIKLYGWVVVGVSAVAILLCTRGLVAGFLEGSVQEARPQNFNLEGEMYAATTAQAIQAISMFVLSCVVVVSALALVGAVGVLKRREWARKLMTGLMVLGVVISLVIFFGNLRFEDAVGPTAAAASALQGLALRRLLANDVRAEFAG
jgi:hypothetical protein